MNGAIPAQSAMASAVALLSSPPAMGVKGQGQRCVYVCVCMLSCVSILFFMATSIDVSTKPDQHRFNTDVGTASLSPACK